MSYNPVPSSGSSLVGILALVVVALIVIGAAVFFLLPPTDNRVEAQRLDNQHALNMAQVANRGQQEANIHRETMLTEANAARLAMFQSFVLALGGGEPWLLVALGGGFALAVGALGFVLGKMATR